MIKSGAKEQIKLVLKPAMMLSGDFLDIIGMISMPGGRMGERTATGFAFYLEHMKGNAPWEFIEVSKAY